MLTTALTSCLKDKDYDDGSIQSLRSRGSQNIIELSLTATSTDNYLNIALANRNVDTSFDLIPVTLADGKPAKEDIKVLLVSDPALIGSYNADNGTTHEDAPTTIYSILNPAATGGGYEVTIPKGSNTGFLRIKINAANFIGHDYAIAFQISKVITPGYLVSSNISTGIVAIGIKNDYEGTYDALGFFQHPTSPRDIDREVFLRTAGATSVSKVLGDLDGTNIVITINPNNTVNIAPGDGTSGSTASVAAIAGDATYNNTYNPATKTFWLKYGYPQPGPTRIITEKVTKQ